MYLTPAAVGYLTQLILAALISGYFLYLLRRTGRVSHIVWLSGFFVALTGFIATLFLEAALLPTPRLYAVFLQNTLLGAALTCLLQFAYHFPAPIASRRREAHLVLYLSGLYTLWEAGYAVFRFAQLRVGHILYRPAWSDYALLLFLLWTPLSFLRQMRTGKHESKLGRHFPARETRAARGFLWIFLFVASLSLFNILRSVYLLSVALSNLGISLGMLLALFSFAVTYLNYRPETTSFMIKLVGVTLTVVLAIMGVVGWIVSPAYEAHYHPASLDRRTLRFTPNEAPLAGSGYTIAQIPFTFVHERGRKLALAEDAARTCSDAVNFPFPFYGRTYSQVYVCNDGAVSLGKKLEYRIYQYHYGAGTPLILPLLMDLYPEISAGGIFVQQEPERLVVTWDRVRGFRQQESEFTFQAVLYANGIFDFSYNGLPKHLVYHPNDDPGASVWAVGALPDEGGYARRRTGPQLVAWTDLPLSSGPDGVLEDYRLEFRQHLHRLFAPLAGLILAASVLIVTGFPLLFYITLVDPLNALLRGVRRIEAGEYDSRVPVQYMDEIGFLTRAFNALAAQLEDLIHNLEARVAARTAELDAANAQLRDEIAERERAQAALVEQQRALATFEERERLGHELHDGLGQVMGYINVQAQTTQTLLDDEKTLAARSNLDDLARAAQKAHADIRGHILGLRTTGPSAPDFSTTVRDYVRQFGEQFGIAVSLSLPDDAPIPLFASGVEGQVLRIVQEALTNARKHARATRVEVVFGLVGDQVQLLVADDGVGFAPPPLTSPPMGGTEGGEPHFGLDIMRERAEQIGGRLEIRSAPGEGTRILVTLPRFLPTETDGAEVEIKGLRLLLADDHPLFLDGLRNLLLARGLTVIGVARDGQEALEKARALHPDVVVMDLNMPRRDGLEATRAIKAELPDVKIVILTVSEDEGHLFEAIKSGASGYLLKSLEANQFCSLLTGVMRGEAPLSPGLAERVLAEFARAASLPATSPEGRPVETLTPRQQEILSLVAQGVIYKEIGERLHLSEKTIKYHMAQILEKLHVENRAQAIAYYHRQRRK